MKQLPSFTVWTFLALLTVMSVSAGTRAWYVVACCSNGYLDPEIHVQDRPLSYENALLVNFAKDYSFMCQAPLAKEEETTAHSAPLYPLLVGLISSRSETPDWSWRWLQVVLGSLTAVCYFFFARRSFHNTLVATLAGLLAAFHPFWIFNTGEMNDGVLASFMLGLALALGARGAQSGGPLTGLAFGFALAAVALTRAALLPFAVVALLWFIWECRRHPLGWFAAFLALLGFVNGLAPWALRNWQAFERPVPVATSTYLHLWMGNNPRGIVSTLDDGTLKPTLSDERWKELRDEPNQTLRYNALANDVWQEVKEHPAETLARRIEAALAFFLGDNWLKSRQVASMVQPSDTIAESPDWVREHAPTILQGALLAMIALGLLGWRYSHAWRRYGRLCIIAAIFIPLPYIVSHAEPLHGPRLPLDGVVLCFMAYALASLVPGLVSTPGAAAKQMQQQQQES
ncbi:MAG: glycosyltransferase family 39 protein [Planctomycetes bacterium]|nr:glycosyltransferase family 39 protein [Planctomycetota bacterium]